MSELLTISRPERTITVQRGIISGLRVPKGQVDDWLRLLSGQSFDGSLVFEGQKIDSKSKTAVLKQASMVVNGHDDLFLDLDAIDNIMFAAMLRRQQISEALVSDTLKQLGFPEAKLRLTTDQLNDSERFLVAALKAALSASLIIFKDSELLTAASLTLFQLLRLFDGKKGLIVVGDDLKVGQVADVLYEVVDSGAK